MNKTKLVDYGKKRIVVMAGGAILLLLIPLIAMQFTDEVRWTGRDFAVMGILLLLTATGLEIALRKVKTTTMKILACGVILTVLLLAWGELAVGIFGTPLAGH